MDSGRYVQSWNDVVPTSKNRHRPQHSSKAKAAFDAIYTYFGGRDIGELADDEEISRVAQAMSKARIEDANTKHGQ